MNGTFLLTLAETAGEIASWNGVTQSMLDGVFDDIKSLLPMVAPAVVSFIGLRKAWSFLKGQIKGA